MQQMKIKRIIVYKPKIKTTKFCCITATTDGFQQHGASFFYTMQYKTQMGEQRKWNITQKMAMAVYSKLMGC